jgi:hypothetical protein
MKRRGFFGFAAGAAVAGPSIAKEAIGQIASGLEATSLGLGGQNAMGGAYGLVSGMTQAQKGGYFDPKGEALSALARLSGITAGARDRMKRTMTHVSSLDPDIASYRSLSLNAKIEMQRERQFERILSERRSYWQRMVDGVMGEDGEDWLP